MKAATNLMKIKILVGPNENLIYEQYGWPNFNVEKCTKHSIFNKNERKQKESSLQCAVSTVTPLKWLYHNINIIGQGWGMGMGGLLIDFHT